MQLSQPRIEVNVGPQRMTLWDGTRQVRSWPVSTSKFGLGSEEGSFKTPLGAFEIREKHGEGAEWGTIFKGRKPVGTWTEGDEVDEDLVLTRILWLHGLQPHNANTYERYVYIHGTNGERDIGRPASHGCVRLSNGDVTELFDLAPVGTPVSIVA
jgi:lipoprotein-anchoring transpeptidase ErfK/SrfK